MARDKNKNKAAKKPPKQDKPKNPHSFWSGFFEPVPEDEDIDPAMANRLYGEPPEIEQTVHLFSDDEVEYSDELDVAAVESLTWDDGEPILTEEERLQRLAEAEALRREREKRARPAAKPPERSAKKRGTEEARGKAKTKKKRGTDEPKRAKGKRPEPERPRKQRPPSEQTYDDEIQYAETPAYDDGVQYAETPAYDDGTQYAEAPVYGDGTQYAEAPVYGDGAQYAETPAYDDGTQYAEAPVYGDGTQYAEAPVYGDGAQYAETPATPIDLFEDGADADAAALPFETEYDAAEPIRLFDDDGNETGSYLDDDTARIRMFRTGTASTTRIHVKQTESAIRSEEARRRAEARAAQERREAMANRRDRRKKRIRTVRSVFGNIAFMLFLIATIAVALYYGFLLTDIIVVGNDTYTSDYIIEQSGLERGRHMLMCDLDAAEEAISENPYLQVDGITYIFPSRIRITITERKEAAGIIGLDYNVIIDKNGYVLSMSGGTDLSKLLRVTGVSMTGFQLGQRLGQGNDFTTATLIQLIEQLEEYNLMQTITAVDMTTPLAITMTASNGLKIHLGQATDLPEKMYSLSRLIPQFLSKNISTGTLYLSARGGTVYSPSSAESNARLAREAAQAAAAQMIDNDGDGKDDVTGADMPVLPDDGGADTTLPGALTGAAIPSSTPAPSNLGGTSDSFSG